MWQMFSKGLFFWREKILIMFKVDQSGVPVGGWKLWRQVQSLTGYNSKLAASEASVVLGNKLALPLLLSHQRMLS